MSRPKYDIGAIIRQHLNWIWNSHTFTVHQKKVLQAIADCRTNALGTHKIVCTDCGSIQFQHNSCRNRNCPKCQASDREKWIKHREADLLPVPYFHVVFTLPNVLNQLCRKYPKVLYNCLFTSAWYTINKLGHDPKWLGAQTGMTAVLHTWGSNLALHPHLHCIVPGGGLTKKGIWKSSKSKGKYLFNRQVMGLIFRARFVKQLRHLIRSKNIPASDIPSDLFKQLFKKQWITYAKRPFLKPQNVIEYLGRYSHKVAITNYRITNVAPQQVDFKYKDYRNQGKQKIMSLEVKEFIRRFAMHIIPHRFIRIRHYGFLANRNKKIQLEFARKSLKVLTPSPLPKTIYKPLSDLHRPAWCSCCEKITPHLILEVLPPVRGSPFMKTLQYLNSVK